MNEYVPPIEDIEATFVIANRDHGNLAEAEALAAIRRGLNAIRPNPDDPAWQRAAKRVLEPEFGPFLARDPHDPDRFWNGAARAVLAALAEGVAE